MSFRYYPLTRSSIISKVSPSSDSATGSTSVDHRYRESDGEYAGNGAQRPDQLTERTDGPHVSVSDGRHRHHGPPKRIRDAVEVRVVDVGLGEVDGAGKEHDADEQEEDEQAKLAHAGADRLTEDLQSFRVTRQFEDAEHADEPHHAQDRQRLGLRAAARPGTAVRLPGVVDDGGGESDEVRHDSDQVDDVHRVAEERCSVM